MRPGTLPVYDEALKLINTDSNGLKGGLQDVLARVGELEKEISSASGEALEALERELEALREKAKILEIQCEINLPSTRWYAANGMGE